MSVKREKRKERERERESGENAVPGRREREDWELNSNLATVLTFLHNKFLLIE